jgi:hypothetical protein
MVWLRIVSASGQTPVHPDAETPMRGTTGLLVLVSLVALGSVITVPVVGKLLGRDADFALMTLDLLSASWAEGSFWPRWLMDSNFGLGGTTLYTYPPLAFWAAAGVSATTGAGTPESLGIAMAGWRLLSVVTAALWLRRHLPARAAWAGAAFGALLPYVAMVDPWVRFAYSETAAIALLPLLLMALEGPVGRDAARPRPGAGLPAIALAYAALALTNLPICTLAAHFGPLYAWAYGGRQVAFRCLLGGVIGAALAAAFLLPAIGLLGESNAAALFNPSWRANLLGYAALENRLLLVWAAGAVALACSLWLWRLALPGGGWPRPGLGRALGALVLGSAVLTCVVSLPLWLILPQLTAVEHPWRSIAFLTPAVSGLAALALVRPSGGRVLEARLFALGVPLALLPAALLLALGVFGHPHWPLFLPADQRMDFARGYSGAYSWEHVPATAATAGWATITAGAADPHPRPALPPGTLRLRDGYRIPAADKTFSLPQFHFPAWVAHDALGPVELRADAAGLLEVVANRPLRDLEVRIRPTLWERAGWLVSIATAAGLLAMLLLEWLRRPGAAPGSRRAPLSLDA